MSVCVRSCGKQIDECFTACRVSVGRWATPCCLFSHASHSLFLSPSRSLSRLSLLNHSALRPSLLDPGHSRARVGRGHGSFKELRCHGQLVFLVSSRYLADVAAATRGPCPAPDIGRGSDGRDGRSGAVSHAGAGLGAVRAALHADGLCVDNEARISRRVLNTH
jgi:hypothetical protein